jgi:FkbM family methyltransferase
VARALPQVDGTTLVDLGDRRLLARPHEAPRFATGGYERVTCDALRAGLGPGGTFVDVGAHIGYMTVDLGLAGACVHAVEPDHENAELLAANVRLNGLESVVIHRCAAGDQDGVETFYRVGESSMHGLRPHPLSPVVQTTETPVRRLDDLVQGKVDVVKIDVEGTELEVLRGMTRILADNPRITLCVEWNPAAMRGAGYGPLELLDALKGLGFDRLEAADEAAGQIITVDHLWPYVAAGRGSGWWYGNVHARRS